MGCRGGTIIGIRQGAFWVRDNVLDYVAPEEGEMPVEEVPDDGSGHAELLNGEELQPERHDYADKQDIEAGDLVRGTIFAGDLDITHPLGFGHPDRVAVFKTNTLFFEGVTPAGNDVGVYTDEPLLSGYISDENLERLRGKSAIMATRQGQGRVVLMDFEPSFRAFWYGTDGLLLNAVFFGGVF